MDIQEQQISLNEKSLDKNAKVSRNFENRTELETQELYDTIKEAVLCAQDPQNDDSDKALAFIVFVFDPLIRKIAGKIYFYIKDCEEYEDILQETYATFIRLVYGYNPSISAFPYYIKNMLPRQVKAWSQRTKRKSYIPVDTVIVDNAIADPFMNSKDSVYERYNSYVMQEEYKEFIMQRAERKTKSNTVKEVCYNYFLGSSSCTQLAKKLGISYHAVYEIIQRIKLELQVFLEENTLTELEASSMFQDETKIDIEK